MARDTKPTPKIRPQRKRKQKRLPVFGPKNKPKPRARKSRGFNFRKAGTKFGSRIGSYVGKTAGNWLSTITGMGSYRVNSNNLMTDNGIPQFGNRGGGTRIRHREFLTDITGSTSFTLIQFFLNPGLAASFPWLSNIAYNYEQYRFHGLIFEFRTTSATAVSSTNTALGTVVMATDYDDLDAVFVNKQQMEAYEFSVSTTPIHNAIHPIECSPRETPLPKLWVRSGSYSSYSTVDPRLYDLGRFQLATVGMQAAATVGELWVSYDVEFFKPKLPTPYNANVSSFHAYGALSTSNACFSNPTTSSTSTLSVTFSGGTSTYYTGITFGETGRYLVTAIAKAGTSISNWGDFSASTYASLVTAWSTSGNNNASNVNSSGAGTSSTSSHVIVDITTANGILLFSNALTVVGGGFWDLFVTELPGNFQLANNLVSDHTSLADKIRCIESQLELFRARDECDYTYLDHKEPPSPTPSASCVPRVRRPVHL
nr:MAG: capsid protein [Chemarfal virus 144]